MTSPIKKPSWRDHLNAHDLGVGGNSPSAAIHDEGIDCHAAIVADGIADGIAEDVDTPERHRDRLPPPRQGFRWGRRVRYPAARLRAQSRHNLSRSCTARGDRVARLRLGEFRGHFHN